jgi:SAM-dependent methyltransferase
MILSEEDRMSHRDFSPSSSGKCTNVLIYFGRRSHVGLIEKVLSLTGLLRGRGLDYRIGGFGGFYRVPDRGSDLERQGEGQSSNDNLVIYVRSEEGTFLVQSKQDAFTLVSYVKGLPTRFDYTYVVVEGWYGQVNLLELLSLLRRSDRLYFFEHRVGWTFFPFNLRNFFIQQALLLLSELRPLIRRAGLLLAVKGFGKRISERRLEVHLHKTDSILAMSKQELTTRFGEDLVSYLTKHDPRVSLRPAFFLRYAARANFLEHLIGPLHGKTVLEIGSGTGLQARIFTEDDNVVIGLDIQHSRARMLSAFGCKNLSGVCADTLSMPFCPGTFDVIYAHDTIQHVADITRTFAGCYHILRSGGYLVISEVNPKSLQISFMYNRFVPFRQASRQLYRNLRRQYLQEIAPMDQAELDAIVEKTDSFTCHELDSLAASGFDQNLLEKILQGKMEREEFFEYRHPLTGYCEERLVTPARLTRSLVGAGFQRENIRIVYHHNFKSTIKEGTIAKLFINHYVALAKK